MDGLRVMARHYPHLTAFIIGWPILLPMLVAVMAVLPPTPFRLVLCLMLTAVVSVLAVEIMFWFRDHDDNDLT